IPNRGLAVESRLTPVTRARPSHGGTSYLVASVGFVCTLMCTGCLPDRIVQPAPSSPTPALPAAVKVAAAAAHFSGVVPLVVTGDSPSGAPQIGLPVAVRERLGLSQQIAQDAGL